MRIILGVAAAAILAVLAWFVFWGGRGELEPLAEPAGVVNVYSARHYDGDRALFRDFEDRSGIRVNVFEASAEQLIERLKAEGAESPADLIITVDAGNISRAMEAGLLQPIQSSVLNAALPVNLRDPGGAWYALTRRARVLAVDKARVPEGTIGAYSDLADPRWKNAVCVRSSGNVYNLSLMAALIGRWGAAEAELWARGVVANLARPPQGGDTDQIKAVAAGQCAVALVNHYYLLRLQDSDKPEDRAIADKVRLIFPDQQGLGTHVNISGAGVAKHANNAANAQQLLEFLLEPAQQAVLAAANQEFPAAIGVPAGSPALKALGSFREDAAPLSDLGARQAEAQAIFDRAGWK